MGEIFDKGSTILIVLLIIGVIAGFGFAAWKIMEPSPENKTDLATTNNLNQSTIRDEIVENINDENVVSNTNSVENEDLIVDEENPDDIENENIVEDSEEEEIDPIIATNVLNVKKYEEDGFMKVENVSFSTNYSKTKMIYNFNNNPYNLEFVYPYEWNMGGYSLQGNITVVQCSKDTNSMTSAIINEINIEDNPGISYEDALLLLETKIREYADSIGDIYEVNNAVVEEIETEDGVQKVLKFEYDMGQYYKTYCYSKIEIVDSYMYVLTVGISSREFNDELIAEKDSILKSFKVSDAD